MLNYQLFKILKLIEIDKFNHLGGPGHLSTLKARSKGETFLHTYKVTTSPSTTDVE